MTRILGFFLLLSLAAACAPSGPPPRSVAAHAAQAPRSSPYTAPLFDASADNAMLQYVAAHIDEGRRVMWQSPASGNAFFLYIRSKYVQDVTRMRDLDIVTRDAGGAPVYLTATAVGDAAGVWRLTKVSQPYISDGARRQVETSYQDGSKRLAELAAAKEVKADTAKKGKGKPMAGTDKGSPETPAAGGQGQGGATASGAAERQAEPLPTGAPKGLARADAYPFPSVTGEIAPPQNAPFDRSPGSKPRGRGKGGFGGMGGGF